MLKIIPRWEYGKHLSSNTYGYFSPNNNKKKNKIDFIPVFPQFAESIGKIKNISENGLSNATSIKSKTRFRSY